MSNPTVGAGNLRTAYDSLVHMVGDVLGGNYDHAKEDLATFLREALAAYDNLPTGVGDQLKALQSKVTVHGNVNLNDHQKAQIKAKCEELKGALPDGGVHGDTVAAGKVDWQKILSILSTLIPLIFQS